MASRSTTFLRTSLPGRLLTAILCAFTSLPGMAATCVSDVSEMDRGERRAVLVCGAGIPPSYRLDGLEAGGISVEYQQYLKRCSPEVREPGTYLWLRASDGARDTTLVLRDSRDGAAVCDPIPIAVVDRELASGAGLQPIARAHRRYRLEILAPSGVDFSEACGSALAFPATVNGPSLQQVPSSPLECTSDRVRAVVSALGDQRFPAKVVASGIVRGSRERREVVAYVSLPEPKWAKAMPASAARYIVVNGYRTRYFDAGRGEDTIILVHGGQPDPVSPTAEFWRQNFAGLSRNSRVIAYDVLGSGLTENPRTADDYLHYYERAAEHLYGLVRELRLTRVHLVGHSQGGWPVLRVALDYPDVVKSVVSVDTVMAPFSGAAGNTAVSRFAYILMHGMPAEGPTVPSLMREQVLAAATWNNISQDWTEERMRFARLPKLAEAKAALQAIRMSPGHPAFRELRRRALMDLEEGRLTVPHLLVWGYQDPLAPFELGLEFLKIASHGPAPTTLTVISPAGHSPQLEQPAQFNAAVESFVGQHRRRH